MARRRRRRGAEERPRAGGSWRRTGAWPRAVRGAPFGLCGDQKMMNSRVGSRLELVEDLTDLAPPDFSARRRRRVFCIRHSTCCLQYTTVAKTARALSLVVSLVFNSLLHTVPNSHFTFLSSRHTITPLISYFFIFSAPQLRPSGLFLMKFSSHSEVTDLGRSSGRLSARSQKSCAHTPYARPTPKRTV